MRLKIFHKLFGSLVLVTSAALVVLAALSWYILDRGFLSYLQMQDEAHLTRLSSLLVREWHMHHGWDALSARPERWARIIALAEQEDVLSLDEGTLNDRMGDFDPSRPPPPRGMPPRRRDGSRPDLPPPQNNRPPPPPEGLRGRLTLYDADRLPVFGKVEPPPDVTLRPLQAPDRIIGYLGVAPLRKASAPTDIDFLKSQTRELVLTTLALMALAALIAAFMARHLGRPITSLAAGARRLSAGAYGTRVAFQSKDELGDLARDFNNLAHTLEQNEQARRRWTADISHELRTPLAVLRGELEALRDGVRPVNEGTLDSLHTETLYLGKLVNDLYDLSLADIGALTYQKSPVDPMEVLDQVARVFTARLSNRGLALACDPSPGVRISADENRLRQLFTNLLENACRYTEAPGRIRVTAAARDGYLHMRIEDSAPGPADCTRLFERFHREDPARARAQGGAGLGLAICKAVVEAHEGTIQARPSELGGLCLDISFPRE